jgi:hypothetical protein
MVELLLKHDELRIKHVKNDRLSRILRTALTMIKLENYETARALIQLVDEF